MKIIHKGSDLQERFAFSELDVTTVHDIYFVLLGPTGYVQKQMSMNGTDPLYPNDDVTVFDANNVDVRLHRNQTEGLSYGRYTFQVKVAYDNANFNESVEIRSDSFPTFIVVQNTERTYEGEGIEVEMLPPSGGGQTDDIQAALDGANTPSASNVFATINDVSASGNLTADEVASIQGANSPSASNPMATMSDIGAVSEENYTTAEKTKLTGIEDGAEANQTNAEVVAQIDAALGQEEWKTGGTGIVDSELSETSTNAVQNKAITKALIDIMFLESFDGGSPDSLATITFDAGGPNDTFDYVMDGGEI